MRGDRPRHLRLASQGGNLQPNTDGVPERRWIGAVLNELRGLQRPRIASLLFPCRSMPFPTRRWLGRSDRRNSGSRLAHNLTSSKPGYLSRPSLMVYGHHRIADSYHRRHRHRHRTRGRQNCLSDAGTWRECDCRRRGDLSGWWTNGRLARSQVRLRMLADIQPRFRNAWIAQFSVSSAGIER